MNLLLLHHKEKTAKLGSVDTAEGEWLCLCRLNKDLFLPGVTSLKSLMQLHFLLSLFCVAQLFGRQHSFSRSVFPRVAFTFPKFILQLGRWSGVQKCAESGGASLGHNASAWKWRNMVLVFVLLQPVLEPLAGPSVFWASTPTSVKWMSRTKWFHEGHLPASVL